MRTPRRRPLALASLCTLLFLTFLDNTVVSVALASIQSDLHDQDNLAQALAALSSFEIEDGGESQPFAILETSCASCGSCGSCGGCG